MKKINKTYFALTLLLLFAEVFIGTCMHDAVIRPFGGDFLVVILIYCFIKSFVNKPATPVAAGVLLFAYLVEGSQYFHLVSLLGLQHSKIAVMILGSSFSWVDMFCYTLGIALVSAVEKTRMVYTTPIKKAAN
jgi:DNA integrity scanning protein DisA with diadenylate cyclase activity